MGGLKNFFIRISGFLDLGTPPVYYGRRIFYYGMPQKLFTITLNSRPGNTTSLLWEEDFFYYGRPQKFFRRISNFWTGNTTSLLWEEYFLLWDALKTFHNHFEF